MHVSLDGFVAGKNGEMDWISFNDELFDSVGHLTETADAALYGRKTFEMMDAYWPTAADTPNPSAHTKQHAAWYKRVTKYVVSNTMQGKDRDKTKFINGDLKSKVNNLKQESAGNIVIFGSPSAIQPLIAEGLIDDFYLFINPVILGEGIAMFGVNKATLSLVSTKTFEKLGIVRLHYAKG